MIVLVQQGVCVSPGGSSLDKTGLTPCRVASRLVVVGCVVGHLGRLHAATSRRGGPLCRIDRALVPAAAWVGKGGLCHRLWRHCAPLTRPHANTLCQGQPTLWLLGPGCPPTVPVLSPHDLLCSARAVQMWCLISPFFFFSFYFFFFGAPLAA